MQDVLWVPSDPSQFITWGSALRHYSVTRDQEVSGWWANQKQAWVNISQSELSISAGQITRRARYPSQL